MNSRLLPIKYVSFRCSFWFYDFIKWLSCKAKYIINGGIMPLRARIIRIQITFENLIGSYKSGEPRTFTNSEKIAKSRFKNWVLQYGLLNLYPTMPEKSNGRRWPNPYSLQSYFSFKLYGSLELLKSSKRSELSELPYWADCIFHRWDW